MKLHVHWGLAVGLAYLLFAGSTVGFVVFALGRPVELVSSDYYQRSLAHDGHVRAAGNADRLGAQFLCEPSPDGRTLVLRFPASDAAALTGSLTLYRPASQRDDRQIRIAPDRDGVQRVALDGLARGRWVAQVAWRAHGVDYYRERAVEAP